jgi:PAS domain S-box-containing protein
MDATHAIDPLAAPEAQLLAISRDLLGSVGADGVPTSVNPAWTRLLGWPEELLLRTPLAEIAAEGNRVVLDRLLCGEPAEGTLCALRCADGSERLIRWTARAGARGTLLAGHDVTEHERLADELQDFAYIASHDLAEPVRMVTAYLDLLQRRYGGRLDDTADEFISYAVDGAQRLQAMIEALLAFSRVGTHVMERVEFALADVLGDSLGNGVELAEPAARVAADPTQIAQLLHHLIDNALKFRAPDRAPAVTVSAAEEDGGVRIAVADNGLGIPEAQQERVFKMFSRLHGRDEFPGTGIGLAVCRRIVERHGGTITLASTPGTGSIFSIWLPR